MTQLEENVENNIKNADVNFSHSTKVQIENQGVWLGMATKPVPAGTHPNPPRFWRGKSALTEFGFGFGFPRF